MKDARGGVPCLERSWNSVTNALKLLVLLLAVGSLALAGCGRRSQLESPDAAPATAVDPADAAARDAGAGPRKPDRPFILDSII